jgi:hypothetical protein
MNWNDAAEDLLQSILSRTPRPIRDQAEQALRQGSEAYAEENGINRVGVNTVVAAWVQSTPETLRAELPRQMEQLGLDPSEYEDLLGS